MRYAWLLVVGCVVLGLTAAHAQDAPPVVVGNQIIARVRDKGPCDSVAQRAAKVEQRLSDVISYQDTQNPKVKVAKKGGIWHVYSGDVAVIGVYPQDTAAQNNIDAKSLAFIWMKNLKQALPKATPVSKLPATPGPKPPPAAADTGPSVPSVPEPPPSGITPAGPATEHATTGLATATAPTGDPVPMPAEPPTPAEPGETPHGAAMLVLLEAFNNVRVLTETEYLAGRDQLAAGVLANIEPFMDQTRSTAVAGGETQPPRPIRVVTPDPGGVTPPTPPADTTPPTDPGEVDPPPTIPIIPSVPSVPSVPTGTGETTVTPAEDVDVPSGDPSYSKVPQKQRIKRKMAAAEGPFKALKAAGDPKADAVYQLLKASRTAHTGGDFDLSETSINEALTMMGVPIPD